MSQYTLGLVSVSFRGHTPKEILEAACAAGLTCIEWGSDVHALCTDLARLDEIAEMQRTYGISCSSYGTYFKFGKTPMEELPDYIAAAKRLGTNVLRLWCGRKSGAETSEAEYAELLAQCKRAAALAEQHDVVLCLECHQKTFTERCEDAMRLMRDVKSPCFRMYWQPFAERSESENLTYARAIAPNVEHLHVFHWKGEHKLPLSEAIGEWSSYLGAFSGPRTLLLEFMPHDTLEELATEVAALKRIIGGS